MFTLIPQNDAFLFFLPNFQFLHAKESYLPPHVKRWKMDLFLWYRCRPLGSGGKLCHNWWDHRIALDCYGICWCFFMHTCFFFRFKRPFRWKNKEELIHSSAFCCYVNIRRVKIIQLEYWNHFKIENTCFCVLYYCLL